METITSSKGISRRELLKRCMVVGAGLAVGTVSYRQHSRLGHGDKTCIAKTDGDTNQDGERCISAQSYSR